jgi:hypothetical protein
MPLLLEHSFVCGQQVELRDQAAQHSSPPRSTTGTTPTFFSAMRSATSRRFSSG